MKTENIAKAEKLIKELRHLEDICNISKVNYDITYTVRFYSAHNNNKPKSKECYLELPADMVEDLKNRIHLRMAAIQEELKTL